MYVLGCGLWNISDIKCGLQVSKKIKFLEYTLHSQVPVQVPMTLNMILGASEIRLTK